jgi:hypothetical protein
VAYEPKLGSKVAILLDAMRAQAATREIWSQAQAATVMDVPRSMVPTYVSAACDHKLMYRRTLQTGIELSLQPFDRATALTYPKYEPAKVIVPREGSDVPRPKGSPPKLCPGCSKSECWDDGCQQAVKDAMVSASTPAAPAPPPTPPEASDIRSGEAVTPGQLTHTTGEIRAEELVPVDRKVFAGPEQNIVFNQPVESLDAAAGIVTLKEDLPSTEEEGDEAAKPNAFIDCGTGDVVLVNCEIDEDNRCTVPADLMNKIVARVAWRRPQ